MDPSEPQRGEESAFDRLVAACPTFLSLDDVDRYVAFLEGDDAPDRYVRTTALAHHLVDLLADGVTGPVTEVFDAVEVVVSERDDEGGAPGPGQDDVVELVRMGLLEPLGNICSHPDVPVEPAVVESLLGPRGRELWQELEVLWADAARHATDGPRVSVEQYEGVRLPELRRYFQATRRRMPDGTLLAATDIVRLGHKRRRERLDAARMARRVPLSIVLALVVAAMVALVVLT
ncbi:MAG: hypothetical protein JJU45_18205 [Acidimicrobiia bacterium]|nr:hypothetical protein [Acidimicrobiia bacterium]